METVKIEKSLKYSDFILNGYGCLWLFPSHHFPLQKVLDALSISASVVLKDEPEIDKNVIAYIVAAISEFAKSHHLSVREASNYLIRFKGIDFLTEHYYAEHLLSFDDSVQDLTQVCLNNGGGIR